MLKQAKQMIVFNALTQQKSFTKAAQLLDISRTQVSLQIQLLEERLGVQLVQRTTRSFSLTEAGQSFAVHCANIADEINEAENELLSNIDTLNGKLRVGIAQSFATNHILPYLSELHQRYPQLNIEITLFDHKIDVIAEQLDLWIGVMDSPPEGFVARHLIDCHFVLVANSMYLAKHGIPYHPYDLKKHNCLTYMSRERKDNVWGFHKGDENLQIKVSGNYRIDSADAIRNATVSGNGIGYIATYLLSDELRSGKLVQLLPDWELNQSMPLYAVYPRRKFLAKKVHIFMEFVRHHINAEKIDNV